jgi:hypothetical protein
VVKPGNWYIELDDGSGADLHTEIDGIVRLEIGDVLPGRIYGRKWRIKLSSQTGSTRAAFRTRSAVLAPLHSEGHGARASSRSRFSRSLKQ